MIMSEQSNNIIIKAITWHKHSNNMFDYEFSKDISKESIKIGIQSKYVVIYRNNQNSQIVFKESEELQPKILQKLQLLCWFKLRRHHKKVKLQFYHASQVQKIQKHKQYSNNEEDIYVIVRSFKDKYNENIGYKLEAGQIVKFGRVAYKIISMVTEIDLNNQNIQLGQSKSLYSNQNVMEWLQTQKKEGDQCKYCLEGQQLNSQYFFISPCNCTGSAGLVHFKCLSQWIGSKVKKQATGGTVQYNFQKFYCELCETEYPRFIKKGTVFHQLMQIQTPKGPHLILETICQKNKNLLVIQNIPEEGIKIGRSNECQIRIQDASISRNHAYIQSINGKFTIFDSKSKFGTLVWQNKLNLQLSNIKKGLQIGRTVLTFQIN